MQQRNILLFTHHLSGGGAEKAVRTLSEYINSEVDGYTSWICVVYDDKVLHGIPKNVIVLRHRSSEDDNPVQKGMNVLAQIQELRRIKKRFSIDVCVSFLPGADFINVNSGTGELQIVSVRNIESRWLNRVGKKAYVKYSYRRCDRIVAVSELARLDVIRNFGISSEKVITIHNTVMPVARHECADDAFLKFTAGRCVIINVARLAPEKGQENLLKAFKMIKDSEPAKDLCLVIIGEGAERESLENIIDKLGLGSSVMLTGYKSNPADYMYRSDIFVLSSLTEGMPNSLLEAMACGLPVISTDCGAREILDPDAPADKSSDGSEVCKYGILVKSGNVNDLADGMMKLLETPQLINAFIKRNSECLSSYRIDAIVDKWIKVFDMGDRHKS